MIAINKFIEFVEGAELTATFSRDELLEKARSLMAEAHVAEVQSARDEWDRPAAPAGLAELAKSKGWKLKYALFNPLQVIMEFESEAKTRAFLESNKLSRRGSLE